MRIPDFIRDADADDKAFAGAVSLVVLVSVGLLFLAFGIWGGVLNVLFALFFIATALAAIAACVLYLMNRF